MFSADNLLNGWCCRTHSRANIIRSGLTMFGVSALSTDWLVTGICWESACGRRTRSTIRTPPRNERTSTTCGTHCLIVTDTTRAHARTHPFNGPFSGTTQVSRYQKGKTNLDFTEARDTEWQWHQLGHMQVCTSLQTDNHTSTPLLSFLQAICPS